MRYIEQTLGSKSIENLHLHTHAVMALDHILGLPEALAICLCMHRYLTISASPSNALGAPKIQVYGICSGLRKLCSAQKSGRVICTELDKQRPALSQKLRQSVVLD